MIIGQPDRTNNYQHMKTALVFLILLGVFVTEGLPAQNNNWYEQRFETIDSLQQEGLPREAFGIFDTLYHRAIVEKNQVMLIRTIVERNKTNCILEEDPLVQIIGRIKDDLGQIDSPAQQIMHSLLAEIYWKYYQNNRWKFHNRTAIEGQTTETDIRTWDLEHLVREMLLHLDLSVQQPTLLQNTPVEQFKALLEGDSVLRFVRPTLYDLLAHRALLIIQNPETGLTRPSQSFELNAPEFFAPADRFAGFKLTSDDSLSLTYRGAQLFQDLTRFRLNANSPEALTDLELNRIEWIFENSNRPDKDSLTVVFYQHLFSQNLPAEAKAETGYRLALYYFDHQLAEYGDRLSLSHQLCEDLIGRFPETKAAELSRQLKNKIEEPVLTVTCEGAELPNRPFRILATWRNMQAVTLSLYKVNSKASFDYFNQYNFKTDSLKKLSVFAQWDQALPVFSDFLEHSAELPVKSIPKGFYLLVASKPGSDPAQSAFDVKPVMISALTANSRETSDGKRLFIGNALNGKPEKQAIIEPYRREYDSSERKWLFKKEKPIVTDQNGETCFQPEKQGSFQLKVIASGDTLHIFNQYFWNRTTQNREDGIQKSITFYTDRAIYRPGQLVQFKGIVLEQKDSKHQIVSHYQTTVVLRNVNFEEVATLPVTSNDYGTFNGQFILPATGLNGTYFLSTDFGSTAFQVEEYRRPTFEVQFDKSERSYSFGDSIRVSGRVLTFSGTPVNDATVRCHIVRKEEMFYWWRHPALPEKVISQTDLTTRSDGSFELTFFADQAGIKDPKRILAYTIQADATDQNGETRSNQFTVRISETNLLISCPIPKVITANHFEGLTLKTLNLNGEEVKANVKLTISPLVAPKQLLADRYWDNPDTTVLNEKTFRKQFPQYPYRDENSPSGWSKGHPEIIRSFSLPITGSLQLPELNTARPGYYSVLIEADSPDGKQHTQLKQTIRLITSQASKAQTTDDWVTEIKTTCEPGETAEIWLTALRPDAPIHYELIRGKELLKKALLVPGKKVYRLLIPIEESHRGNITARFMHIANNRCNLKTVEIKVPHSDKQIDIEFSSFRDQLLPGEKEQWSLTLTDQSKQGVAAEMVATLYDASLDQFAKLNWPMQSYDDLSNNGGYDWPYQWYNNLVERLARDLFNYQRADDPDHWRKEYETLPLLNFSPGGYNNLYSRSDVEGRGQLMSSTSIRVRGAKSMPGIAFEARDVEEQVFMVAEGNMAGEAMGAMKEINDDLTLESEQPEPAPDFSGIQARSDFNETAFFYPDLYSDSNGRLSITFTMPDAITRWRMLGYAHTRDLRQGYIEKELVTRKLVSVSAFTPRFLRESDTIEVSAKISNLTSEPLSGSAVMQLASISNFEPVTQQFIPGDTLFPFSVAANSTSIVKWKIIVPKGYPAVTCKVLARAGHHSDGEQKIIPILVNRQLVTESLPFMVRGGEKKELVFDKLFHTHSATLSHQAYTIEYTSNPAWYAIQALPYLMEYPYECAEQVFSRFFANSTASALINRSPRIREVFDSWKSVDTGTFLSNLEKNSELKSVVLQETPWLLEAQSESEAKQRIGLLFDLNRMGTELGTALSKLEQLQDPNGGFPWFKGMPDNRYITQYIAKGLSELKYRQQIDPRQEEITESIRRKALSYLDARIVSDYRDLLEQKQKDTTHTIDPQPSLIQLHYLYTRSFFPDEQPDSLTGIAFDYYFKQARKCWLSYNEYGQGLLALVCHRFGDQAFAKRIVKSLADRALRSNENGMFWKNNRRGYFWNESPIETQALLINVFDEVAGDTRSVEEMKIWLLRNKQTTHWETTKATLAACQALLTKGKNLLDENRPVKIRIAQHPLEELCPVQAEAGTGYVKTSLPGPEIKPEMGKIQVENPNQGIAWGAAYWQYFEQLDKITAAQTDAVVDKQLFIREKTEQGTRLKPIGPLSPITVGQEIVVRITILSKRDMEFVHLKDLRAAGFEPVSTLSGYRWQEGLGYYQEIKDAAVNFFIGYLPKGTYVFEYALRASHSGEFSNGIATLQCMYAPEFVTHSQGTRIEIKP